MKKLMILGGSDIHTKVVECANDMGIYTIVADYYPDSPAKKIAKESVLIDATDVCRIVKWCRENKVDGVLSCGIDPLQIPYQKICYELDLPCYANENQFRIMTNKRLFKDFCSKHNVGIVPDYTIDDILTGNVIYPIIIKPTDSRGSRGQTICYTKKQALEAIDYAKTESSDNGFICERYLLTCYDISNAFFVVNGEPYLVKFGDRYLGKREDNLDKQAMCTRLPSTHCSLFEKNSLENVKNMIRSLGIKYGPVFLQGLIDDSGKVYYYDPGLRMPGSDYERILKLATDVDIVKSLVNFAITGDKTVFFGNPDKCYLLNDRIAYILDISVHTGTIKKIICDNSVLSNTDTVYYSQRLNEGTYIPNSGDIKQRVAEFGVLLSIDNNDINKSINEIYSSFHVYDIEDNDMVISKVSHVF